ncbi:hypothetical protein INR49_032403, partial [Caranx melampygus]
DINTPCIMTDNAQEFGDEENTDFETVFVLADFDSPDYSYLYKRDNRIVGPPVVLHCASKEEKNLVNLVHHMGGTIRKDFSTKVTHLIAYSTHGEKYRLAVCLGTPILTPSWILKAWEKRDDVHFHAGEEDFRTEFKVLLSRTASSVFWFFRGREGNMEERTLKTVVVIVRLEMRAAPHGGGGELCKGAAIFSLRIFVVKQEWFWGSIQMDARAGESMYLYEKNDSPAMKKAVSLLSLTTPNSNLTKETEISPFPPPRKRPSAEHSLSMGSLLDISNTPETCKALAEFEAIQEFDSSCCQAVSQVASLKELYQTESNYVDILSTILQLFKHPLEKEGQVGGPILAQEEIKTIFAASQTSTRAGEGLPTLCQLFEMSKGPSFGVRNKSHAFMRFSRYDLCLFRLHIKKHTADDNPDKIMLEKAIDSLKEVMTHINEDKRKTEGQKQIFDVVYEVDGCPANLLSSPSQSGSPSRNDRPGRPTM